MNNIEPKDGDIQEPPYGGIVDTWEPIKGGAFRAFDVQDPGSPTSSPIIPIHSGEIEAWKPVARKTREMWWTPVHRIVRFFSPKPVVREEGEVQWMLALLAIRMFCVWVSIGLIVLFISGNAYLLAGGTSVLTWPVVKVFGYYFHHPKK